MIRADRQLFSFLDLILGFVGAMYLLIALSAANVGNFDDEEKETFLLIEVDLAADDSAAPRTDPPPSEPFVIAAGKGVGDEFRAVTVVLGANHFRALIYASRVRERRGAKAESLQAPTSRESLVLRLEPTYFAGLRIRSASIRGELEPTATQLEPLPTTTVDLITAIRSQVAAISKLPLDILP